MDIKIQKGAFRLLIPSGFFADFNKAADFTACYALSFTGNRWLAVRWSWIFACSLFRLYPTHSKSIFRFTFVFPHSRNLWNSSSFFRTPNTPSTRIERFLQYKVPFSLRIFSQNSWRFSKKLSKCTDVCSFWHERIFLCTDSLYSLHIIHRYLWFLSALTFLFSYKKRLSLFPRMAGIRICWLIQSHVFPLADILLETTLFPFFIGLWFYVWFLLLFPQIGIAFLVLYSSSFIDLLQGLYAILLEILWIVFATCCSDGLSEAATTVSLFIC